MYIRGAMKHHPALKALTLAIICFLVLAACGFQRRGSPTTAEDTGPVRYGEDGQALTESPSPDGQGTTSEPAGAQSGTRASSPRPRTTSGGGSQPGTTDSRPLIDDFNASNQAEIARQILGDGPYTELVVEIDYVAPRRPSDFAVSHLLNNLRSVTGKKVEVLISAIPAGDGSWSAQEIFSRARLRNTSSEPPRASLWVGYLDGQIEGGGAAGVHFFGTTVSAVFPDTFQRLELYERTVLLHEVGHALSLVNGGYTSPRDHADPTARGCGSGRPCHSNNPDSVMHTSAELLSLLLRGSPPFEFDADDLADLKDLKEGRL